jgi:hypothetical protein
MIFLYSIVFYAERLESPTPNPQAGNPPSLVCPHLLIQHIHRYAPLMGAVPLTNIMASIQFGTNSEIGQCLLPSAFATIDYSFIMIFFYAKHSQGFAMLANVPQLKACIFDHRFHRTTFSLHRRWLHATGQNHAPRALLSGKGTKLEMRLGGPRAGLGVVGKRESLARSYPKMARHVGSRYTDRARPAPLLVRQKHE